MLTGKQKSYLRSLANRIKPVYLIGKDGLDNNVINGVSDYLEAHELIKISLLKTCSLELREVAFDISSQTKSDVVQIIGRTFVLYRKAKESSIILPR